MAAALRALCAVLAVGAFPQASHAGDASEPQGERRLQIILAPDDAAAARTSRTAAAAPRVAVPPRVAAAPLAPPPEPPPAEWAADALRTPMRPGEGWRVQVGAFSEPARAQARLGALESIAAGPGADPIRVVTPTRNARPVLYRAQMSGFVDRAAADAACARIKASGASCFLVSPQ